MSIVAVLISGLALAFSLFTFFSFDAKLKRQEKVLNDYRIKEYKDIEHDKLYAHLSIDTYWRDKSTLKLSINNSGPSNAYNIIVENLDKESSLFQDIASTFPITTIDAGDNIELELLVYSDMPEKNRVKLTWEDDSKEKHTEQIILHILE